MLEKDQKLPSGTEECDRDLQSSARELGSRCMNALKPYLAVKDRRNKKISRIRFFGTTLAPKVLVTSIPTESDIRWP